MKKILGVLLVAVILVLLGVFANNSVVSAEDSAGRPPRQPRASMQERNQDETGPRDEVPNPYADSRVLVEAFLVEITMESLYKSGIGPVGQEPGSTSLESILEKLKDNGDSKVVGGAKIAIGGNNSGECKGEKKVYSKQGQSNNFREDAFGTEFEAQVFVNPEKKIRVAYSFVQVGSEKPSTDDAPPTTISRKWSGQVFLEDGKPAVVGASQDEEKCVFLVISAKIRNK